MADDVNLQSRGSHRLLPVHWHAAWHGWRDGRAGITVEEAADAPFLTSLAASATAARRRREDRLDRELAALDLVIVALARELDRRIVERRRAIERAQTADEATELTYRILAAHYGASFLRRHRDRAFVRLGWRTPPLPVRRRPCEQTRHLHHLPEEE